MESPGSSAAICGRVARIDPRRSIFAKKDQHLVPIAYRAEE
jgi:hypothetical protein